ncbi:MAG: glycoside hydrolase family 30 protein [Flavobacteriaceae bacterium]|nr:glycosyl hydrolase [Bacteroidia bacterium]MBT8268265.1 glycosyl hydrolase [Bacteroidia bacterium]NNF75983.1 glycoside hydrolase family 30 protein [Flavobacteriaceae bacterium]NNK70310.1 glycoside hydrolase family 30 protein [Flavobacteriaceae bacterium]NNL81105.1 glycoside hydrolase family 30 protein [Flavobacteriaceae bacterium]
MIKKHYYLLFILLVISCQQELKEENQTPDVINPVSVEGKTATVITTSKDSNLRLTETGRYKFTRSTQALETENSIFVNPNHTFQSFIGIGGAITDASAEVFAQLSPEKQQELLSAYYGKDGIDYTLMRTSIHSCDFSSGSFTYVEEGDKELKTFSIDHDRKYRLPMIKRAIAEAGGKMLFYMSPWSPPAFMKGKKDMLGGGKLLPEYNEAWALYYAKTIKAYEKEDIPVWGITIQNEPMATQRWESCIYTAEEERDFLKNHLGPTLEKEGLGDKKIVVWDHNRDLFSHRASTIFDDPEASKYAWGIGFHWYETWRGGEPNFNALEKVKEAFPDKKLLFTEGCNEAFDPSKYQYWPNAERYGNSMINDFNQGTVGWTDWNILLDETGGPNHVQNLCFAPVHADTRTDEIIYTPTYYYIGHFSKYIRPGAKRVSTVSSISFLQSTSFQNEDGKIVTVVMNSTDEAMEYKLYVGANMAIPVKIPARAIQSIIY